MTPLFQKLNLGQHRSIVVLNSPASFEPELKALTGISIKRSLAKADSLQFGIAFAVTNKELEAVSHAVAAAAEGDAIVWIAYPKSSSKKYSCEFNRDTGWTALGRAGFEPVRQVAIDEDWSALRFRKVAYIKRMTRNPQGAISVAGRKKARR